MTTGAVSDVVRHPIGFDRWYRVFSTVAGLPPSTAWVEIDTRHVEVRMGWAFRARFPRSAVASAEPAGVRPLSRGVHGFGGRWLVNGSARGIVRLRLEPTQRGRVLGVPVRLRELLVSVDDAPALVAALAPSTAPPG